MPQGSEQSEAKREEFGMGARSPEFLVTRRLQLGKEEFNDLEKKYRNLHDILAEKIIIKLW